MLTRFIVETGAWGEAAGVPLVATSRDFVAMKFQVDAMAAAKRRDVAAAQAAAAQIARLANESGQHPLVKQIVTIQAKQAGAVAALAGGDIQKAITMLDEAGAIEDAIDALSQPPYPIIPAHELYGTLLMEMKRPADAMRHFAETLRRTPGRPLAVYGLARAAEALGDKAAAGARYTEFLELWKHADPDRPELATAKRFLAARASS
jgi:tetratricopeptide (TPR) repeat protein